MWEMEEGETGKGSLRERRILRRRGMESQEDIGDVKGCGARLTLNIWVGGEERERVARGGKGY